MKRTGKIKRYHERAIYDCVYSIVHVRIFKNKDGRLCTELEDTLLEHLCRIARNVSSDPVASSERDPSDRFVVDDVLGEAGRVFWCDGEEVEDAWGQARFEEDFGDETLRLGRVLRGLEDDGVSADEGCGDCADGEVDGGLREEEGINIEKRLALELIDAHSTGPWKTRRQQAHARPLSLFLRGLC
jgi:hypothetical protein